MIADLDRSARVIAGTSGKGGVGKTNLSVNLALALAETGRRTMLVDGDLGLANANILLGLNADATIGDVLAREARVDDVVQQGPRGLFFVPGHSGRGLDPALRDADRRRLAQSFRPYAGAVDHLIVDTASGIDPRALALAAESDRVLLVLSAEPTAFMDAYALVKALVLDHGCEAVSVVANMVDDEAAGARLFRHFHEVVGRFLTVDLSYLGAVPRDEHVRDAVFAKRPCLDAFPNCRASHGFRRIARAILDCELPPTIGGHRFFGLEALHGAH